MNDYTITVRESRNSDMTWGCPTVMVTDPYGGFPHILGGEKNSPGAGYWLIYSGPLVDAAYYPRAPSTSGKLKVWAPKDTSGLVREDRAERNMFDLTLPPTVRTSWYRPSWPVVDGSPPQPWDGCGREHQIRSGHRRPDADVARLLVDGLLQALGGESDQLSTLLRAKLCQYVGRYRLEIAAEIVRARPTHHTTSRPGTGWAKGGYLDSQIFLDLDGWGRPQFDEKTFYALCGSRSH